MLHSSFSPVSLAKARNGTLLLSLLVLFSLLLAACGGGGTTTTKKTTVLNAVGTSTSTDFNPYATGNQASGTLGMIYEPLLYINTLQGGTVTPWLAASYQFSSDGTTLTFHLRPNVQWSDGQPFSSDDVVFTLNMLKQYPALDTNGIWNYLKSVTAPDNSTVTVTLKQPYSPILWYVGDQTYIVPKHIWSSIGDPTKYTNTNPVGTGPFTLKSISQQLTDLVKNPKYWQADKLQVTEIHFQNFKDLNSVQLALAQGTIDWAQIYVPGIQQTFVQRDPAHNHLFYPPNNMIFLDLNLARSPFNQLAVRQAISLAIDRNQIEKVGESNIGSVASPTGLILPNQQKYLAPAYANATFTLDTNKADQLLQSAGFTKGSDGIYADKSGKKLSFNLVIPAGIPPWITETQIITSNLQAIGIKATTSVLSFPAYISAQLLGNFDMTLKFGASGASPYFELNNLLNGNLTAPPGKPAGGDEERWMDATTDQLLNQYASSADDSVQVQAIQGLEKIMVEQLPAIPLYSEPSFGAYRTAHFTGWPDSSNPYANAGTAVYPDDEVVVLHLQPVG